MKDALRRKLRDQRSGLSIELLRQKSANIIQQVKQSEVFINATRVGIYLAVNGEADPAELTKATSLESINKQYYLPVLSNKKNQGLEYVEVTKNSVFKNNQFSIPEPIHTEESLISTDTLDLVIVPLVGFDRKGNRLGMGGGYYDRCFAFKKHKQTKPILMGFAYDFQEVEPLNAEEWDVPLDSIATESELIIVPS